MNKSLVAKKIFSPISYAFKRATKLNALLFEEMSMQKVVDTDDFKFKFYCPNAMTYWRVSSLFSKEPDTIEWIRGFKPSEVFYDIGANIGIYSIFAASMNARVYSFEPESQNYSLLNKNIYLNKFDKSITALNIALTDTKGLDYLQIPLFSQGSALNVYSDTVDFDGNRFQADYKQGVLGFTLDSLVLEHNLPFPNHIKIDVDGLESRIIKGGDQILQKPQLRSILVELNTDSVNDMRVVGHLQTLGYKVISKKQSPIIEDPRFNNIYNYIFTKD